MSKRGVVAVAVGLSFLALAQVADLIRLAEIQTMCPGVWDPMFVGLTRRLAYHRCAFHLAGTMLAGVGLATFASIARPGRLISWLFSPLIASAALWLWSTVGGVRAFEPSATAGNVAVLALGIVVPVVAICAFSGRMTRSIREPRVPRRGIGFAVLVLVWACAFGIVQYRICVPA